jgi:hypothetical protein
MTLLSIVSIARMSATGSTTRLKDLLPAERKEPEREVRGAVRGSLHLPDVLRQPAALRHAAEHEVAEALDDGDQVVEIMGDAAGEPPDGLHLLGLSELFLCLPGCGHVPHEQGEATDLAGFVNDGEDPEIEDRRFLCDLDAHGRGRPDDLLRMLVDPRVEGKSLHFPDGPARQLARVLRAHRPCECFVAGLQRSVRFHEERHVRRGVQQRVQRLLVVAECPFGELPLSDVPDRREDHRLPVHLEETVVDLNGDLPAVPGHVDAFPLHVAFGLQLPHGLGNCSQPFRGIDVVAAPGQELLSRVAQPLAGHVVDLDEDLRGGILVEWMDEYHVVDAAEEEAVAFLAAPQRILCALVLRDVDCDEGDVAVRVSRPYWR